jgi:hypothetical protein
MNPIVVDLFFVALIVVSLLVLWDELQRFLP